MMSAIVERTLSPFGVPDTAENNYMPSVTIVGSFMIRKILRRDPLNLKFGTPYFDTDKIL
jgi:hypothetical protein